MSRDMLFLAKLLEHAEHYEWSLQGFGMLRLYLSKKARLHVWDSRFAVDKVSTIHDHPWHFESDILCGRIRNVVYRVGDGQPTHHEQRIVCGPGGHMVGAAADIRLEVAYSHIVCAGDDGYRMDSDELHESFPDDGTISIIEREFQPDTEHARVFFPIGTEWVSAEPRPATVAEVRTICSGALAKLRAENPERA